MDGIEQRKKDRERREWEMKTALLANPDYDAEKVLADPEEVEVVEETEVRDNVDDTEHDIDYSGVTWEVPTDVDGDFDALLAAQLANANTSVVDEGEEIAEGFVALDLDREWV